MKKIISFLAFVPFATNSVFAAEAGMPQLDPTYWASQVFWLAIIFSSIYFLIAKIFIPKIKSNIDMREDKIRKDLEEAKNFKEEAEKKLKNYQDLIQVAKNDAKKIISESRIKLNEDIQTKKDEIQKKIDQETKDADNEIKKFKSDSLKKVGSISEEMVSEVIKDIFGEELNKSSIKAAVSETLKEKNKNI